MKSPEHSSTRQRILRGLLAFGTLGLGFMWGFLSHRDHLFPHRYLHRAAFRLGLVRQTPRPLAIGPTATPWRELLALPYAMGSSDPLISQSGVVVRDSQRGETAVNVVLSRASGAWSALLFDHDGQTTWRWDLADFAHPWLAEPLATGDLVVLDHDRAISEVAATGARTWTRPGRFHHALQVLPDRIISLRSTTRVAERVHRSAIVEDSEIVVLARDGREIASMSLLDLLLDSSLALLLPTISDEDVERLRAAASPKALILDVLHANNVEYHDGRSGKGPFARPGFLVCMRNLNLVVYIDAGTRELLWAWGPGRLQRPHHASLLAGTRVLVVSSEPNQSEVLEFDPLEQRLTWTYRQSSFATIWGGSAQRLPNGNTLITESATGYAFEVTRSGSTVWEWANPDRIEGNKRRGLYRMTRRPLSTLPFLPRTSGP